MSCLCAVVAAAALLTQIDAPTTRVTLVDTVDRPSFGATRALFAGSAVLGTLGTVATVLGVVGFVEAAGTLGGGLVLAMGMICFFPGIGAVAAAVGMLHKGLQLVARRSAVPEPPPLLIVPHPDPEARSHLEGLTTLATF